MNLNHKLFTRKAVIFTVFFIGICCGSLLWNNITLSYKNPWNVVGQLTDLRFNPLNNILRFIVFISIPSILLVVFYIASNQRWKTIFFNTQETTPTQYFNQNISKRENFFCLLFLIFFSVLFALNIDTYHASGVFDPFHEGESLGTAISYKFGQVPYKDFIFCHGLFQDPLRSNAAFALFGQSVASVRTLESIVKVLAFIVLFLFVWQIYSRNYILTFFTIVIYTFLFTKAFYHSKLFLYDDFIIIPSRDILTFSFLLTIPYLQKFISNKGSVSIIRFSISIVFFSFIPLFSFFYSIDRGLYLFSTYVIITILLYFTHIRKTVFNVSFLLSNMVGLGLALGIIIFFFKGGIFDFIKYTFVVMPKYKELTDGSVFLINDKWYLLSCVILAADLFWLVYRFIKEVKINTSFFIGLTSFFEKYLIEFSMLIVSIFFFRSALGRSDYEHIAYSSSITYVLNIYIITKYYLRGIFVHKIIKRIVLILIFLITGLSLYFIVGGKGVIRKNFPIGNKDSIYIPKNYVKTIKFLKDSLGSNEYFVTMTFEASWYYFVNKPCPIKFPVLWFAEPEFYQRDVIEDFKKKDIKYVLYKNKFWSNSIDCIANEQRLPFLVKYLSSNYVYYKTIDDNELWIKKTDLK